MNNLELIRIGKVGKDPGRNGSKGSQTTDGKQSRAGLLFGALGIDLHLGFDGPNVGFAVLVDGYSTLGGEAGGGGAGILLVGHEEGCR